MLLKKQHEEGNLHIPDALRHTEKVLCISE